MGGIGQGSAISVISPALQQAVATQLSKPLQVAGDSAGNVYVADSGNRAIEMFAVGSVSTTGKPIGTGLTAPTGVAMNGAGDLFIGDSGKLIEIPFVNGALATKQQATILTGLGNHLNPATDNLENVYVADADNKQVVKIPNPQTALLQHNQPLRKMTTGSAWTGPSAIATDSGGNVYVADGNNLWQFTPMEGAS